MLSIIVISKNEEGRIKACLESVKWADEIIILDNGSKDETLEIAKKYTERVFEYSDLDFASIRNKAMEKAKGEWVMYVDCDERVLLPLKEEIRNLIKSNQYSAYAVSRKNVILGQEVNYGPYKKDWVVRLFKRADFKGWSGKVHESAHFNGKLGYTRDSLLHLTHRDVDQIVLKSLEWSKIDAVLRYDSNHPKMSGWRFLRIFFSELFTQGIKRKGFFNGTVGTVDSILQVFSLFITYVRLWQMQQGRPLNKFYDDLDKKLIENNFKY